MVVLGPLRNELAEHRALAAVLSAEDREWLRRMADVLEPGRVVLGMATRPREGVVVDVGRLRVVRAPHGPAGASRAAAR